MNMPYVIVSYRNGVIHGYVSQDNGVEGGFSWRSFMLATVYGSKDEAMRVLREPEFNFYNDGNGGPGSMIRQSAGICSANPIGEIDIRVQPVVLGESICTIGGHVFI